jgi:molecular chaperone HscB
VAGIVFEETSVPAESDTRNAATAIPSKCSTCEALTQIPLSCDDCHQLLAQVQGADFFELFGLPPQYDLDPASLDQKYLTISRNIHPDKYAIAGPEMQAFALRASAAVNNAYAVLRDPVHRAEYMLESAGGPSATQNKQVPQDMLSEILMLREEIEEAKAGGDEAALAVMRRQLEARRDATQARISEHCRDLAAASDETKTALRIELNALKFINNVLGHL